MTLKKVFQTIIGSPEKRYLTTKTQRTLRKKISFRVTMTFLKEEWFYHKVTKILRFINSSRLSALAVKFRFFSADSSLKSPCLRGETLSFFSGVIIVLATILSIVATVLPVTEAIQVSAQEATEWPMAGANPQRTSWTSEEVRGSLKPVWFRPIEPYISPKVQIIAANGQLYISTARGLYALDAATGAEVWVYPTEMPLGHSPTVKDEVVYVGGLDHKLHAIDALTGESLWVFEATAGFQTNPLVVEGKVYVGNRDGYLYAIHAQGEPNAGQLAWKYKTAGPILFSAAYHAGTIYFASNDSYAYALDAQTGSLVWKSDRLPGAGFHSWWPVIQPETNVVVFAGSNNYRHYLPPAESTDLLGKERDDIYPARASDPRGTLFGGRNAAGLVNATRALQYFEEKPWRRTYFVLDKETGEEVTFDFDYDTVAEYAPILWHGTHSGNRYPPVVSVDGKLYQSNHYMSDEWIPGGQVSGWEVGSSKISTPSSLWKAMDEPLAYSGGGNLIYWNHCNDRSAGAFDVTIPNTQFYPSDADSTREWVYFSYNLASLIPGYNDLYEGVNSTDYTINNLFRGPAHSLNGIYGQHGDQNAPIPYQGKVYMHRSNSIIAFGNDPGTPTALPMLETVAVQNADLTLVTTTILKNRLSQEVQEILAAGHLRPGYRSVGIFDIRTKQDYGDHLLDYWHQPTDVLYTLIMALPYLPENQQQQVKTYLQSEYQNFSPAQYTHIGWRDGTARESSSFPQEVESDRENSIPKITGYSFGGWTWPPQMFYGLWKYAEVFGSAQEVFDTSSSKLESPPANEYLIEYPYVHNAYLAGYLGYLELEELAGYPESAAVRAEFNRLLNLRMSAFSKDTPFTDGEYHRALSVARNFIFLVPEIGEYMHAHILAKVQTAVAEYNEVAPYWFVANFEATHGEGVTQHYYDYQSLFQAQAWILEAPREELIKYLDVPVVQVGDFFYIQNLVATIAASTQSELVIIATPSTVAQGEQITYLITWGGTGNALTLTGSLPSEVSVPTDFELTGTTVTPTYNASSHSISWVATPPAEQEISMQYTVTVITDQARSLLHTVELDETGDNPQAAYISVLANPYQMYLPLICKKW